MMGKTNVNSSRFIVIPVSAQFALSASILFFFCYGLHFQTAWFTDEDSVIASFKLVTILMFFSTVLTWFLAFQFELLDKCHSTNDSVRVLLKSTLITTLASFFIHFAAILFGANGMANLEHTFIFSSLLSVICVLPVALFYDGKYWMVSKSTEFTIYSTPLLKHAKLVSLFAVFGSLTSSLAILLDWNKTWQIWPIPSCIGSIAGCVLGSGFCVLNATLRKMNKLH